MNVCTGSVGVYDDWFYEDASGEIVNAVDRKEVVEVIWVNEQWVEANESNP